MSKIKIRPRGYWTKERCHKCALKCKSRSEFQRRFKCADHAARRQGFIDEICSHMKPAGNLQRRYVYVYEFCDRTVYIGLTCNLERRHSEHKSGKKLIGKKIRSGTKYKFIKSSLLENTEAQFEEKRLIKKYLSKKWEILNLNEGGSLGGGKIYWTEETIMIEAAQYDLRTDFMVCSRGAFVASERLQISELVMQHMRNVFKNHRFWYVKQNILNVSKNYNDRSLFRIEQPGAARVASAMGWTAEVTAHMRNKNLNRKGTKRGHKVQ